MLIDLRDTARDAKDARALILTGEGKVFSAGADLDAARAGLATSPCGRNCQVPSLTCPV